MSEQLERPFIQGLPGSPRGALILDSGSLYFITLVLQVFVKIPEELQFSLWSIHLSVQHEVKQWEESYFCWVHREISPDLIVFVSFVLDVIRRRRCS